jgi:hypothetical protein
VLVLVLAAVAVVVVGGGFDAQPTAPITNQACHVETSRRIPEC